MRLGELLIADGLVLPAHVERALTLQRRRPQRLGSILVEAELVTADAVARALGRQRTVPAALERHLAARDASLAALIPPDVARSRLVVPLARSKDGGLVVAMRDPGDAELRAALARATRATIVAAVACELVLRRHVDAAYPKPVDEVDVDLDDMGPAPAHPDVDIDLEPEPDAEPEPEEIDLGDIDLGAPTDILEPATVRAGPAHVPSAAADFLDPETIRIGELVSLDDVGVTRDPRQSDPGTVRRSGQMSALGGAIAPAMATAPTAPPITAPVAPVDLTTTLTRIATATSRDAIAAALTAYGTATVGALIVLAVRQGMAFGDTGFAPELTAAAIEAVTVPLTMPSVIKTAVDTGRPYTGRPPVGSSIQDRLVKLLGKPAGLVVAPISVGGRVASVLVAGCATVAAAEAIAADLATIASACGVAYARLRP